MPATGSFPTPLRAGMEMVTIAREIGTSLPVAADVRLQSASLSGPRCPAGAARSQQWCLGSRAPVETILCHRILPGTCAAGTGLSCCRPSGSPWRWTCIQTRHKHSDRHALLSALPRALLTSPRKRGAMTAKLSLTCACSQIPHLRL